MEMTFGEKLRAWRAENNKTQVNVADTLNCTIVTVSAWERDAKLPSFDFLVALAVMMDVSADWLLGLSDHPTPLPCGKDVYGLHHG